MTRLVTANSAIAASCSGSGGVQCQEKMGSEFESLLYEKTAVVTLWLRNGIRIPPQEAVLS